MATWSGLRVEGFLRAFVSNGQDHDVAEHDGKQPLPVPSTCLGHQNNWTLKKAFD